MYCFSFFRKFFSSLPNEPGHIHDSRPDSPAPIPLQVVAKPEVPKMPAQVRHEEDDDLFKEMQPDYKSPQRIGPAMSSNQKISQSGRFEMDIDLGHSWDVEELN